MVKMNKSGIIRIIEVTIAILLIFAAIIIVAERRKVQSERDLTIIINPLLEEIAKDNTLREKIIADTNVSYEAENELIEFLRARLEKEPYIGYNITICNYNEVCGLDKYPENARGSVYAGTRIISATLSRVAPKKVNLFLWIKG
ncbi:MAG: hypothetical protein QXD13_00400 [Candidatus Pacearchaeota archaeon]